MKRCFAFKKLSITHGLNYMKKMLLFTLFLQFVVLPGLVWAEFSCVADITYSYKKPKDDQPLVVTYATVEARGADEAKAKAALAETASREIPKVQSLCRQQHENEAGCLASKFAASSQSRSALSFTARKAVEDAVINDCKAQQGVCGATVVTEAKCSEIAAAAPAAEPVKDGKAGKEEKKKK